MNYRPIKTRRATVLLLVVSMLALLFVIVTGYLSLARTERAVTIDISQSEITDAILDDTGQRAAELIGAQLRDPDGGVAGGGSDCSWEDIAGYRKSSFLASLEPIWEGGVGSAYANNSQQVVDLLTWPAVTSLDASISSPTPFSLYKLMLETDLDTNETGFTWDDVRRNARRPFMDADGDGVADSHFLLSGPATEAANSMAGKFVQVPSFTGDNPGAPNYDFTTYFMPPDGTDVSTNAYRDQIWRRFDDNARYEVAVRIVSNGGMVALQSPTLYNGNNAVEPFNREFTISMFDAVRDTRDPDLATRYSNFVRQNTLFDDLSEQTASIEQRLRRRFFLPGYGVAKRRLIVRNSPAVLAELQGETGVGFPYTLTATFSGFQSLTAPPNWQRINLGSDVGLGGGGGGMATPPDERLGWAKAVSLNADRYNSRPSNSRREYDIRHATTTVSYSDELARKQVAGDPKPGTSNNGLDLTATRGSTFHGELKFYLGEVSKAFVEVNAAGNIAPGSGRYAYDPNRGKLIIEQLARIYYDMLAGHDGTSDAWEPLDENDPSSTQAGTQRQQALMLAVNTVAFAAPPDTGGAHPGAVDVVRYTDGTKTYSGYGPQPFFSEVVAYKTAEDDQDANDEPNAVNVTLAVELYNPADPYYDYGQQSVGGTGQPYEDVYALPLNRFAISVDDGDPHVAGSRGDGWELISSNGKIGGRSFVTAVIKDKDNGDSPDFPNLINFLPDGRARPRFRLDFVDDRDTSGGGGGPGGQIGGIGAEQKITLHLWRSRANYVNAGLDDLWYHIDQIDVAVPTGDAQFWRSKARDTSPTRYFEMADSFNDGTGDRFARWNVVASFDKPFKKAGLPSAAALDSAKWNSHAGVGGVVDPDFLGSVQPFAPTVPLLTMNAGPDQPGTTTPLHQRLNNLPMFGNPADTRPRSFPTVGFMLFIPRFSHVQPATFAGGTGNTFDESTGWFPISVMLRKQWKRQGGYQGSKIGGNYPVDFGHMPIFDNSQGVQGRSYFDSTNGVGEIPWGLLVFDYFTTLDRTRDANGDGEPDIDPLRVPGRININTAPWYVLSKLPMIGPMSGSGDLPIALNGAGGQIFPNAGTGPIAPSPAFWANRSGVLTGVALDADPVYGLSNFTERLLATDPLYAAGAQDMPAPVTTAEDNLGIYRLGPWLAQSAAAYRDGVQYVAGAGQTYEPYSTSHLRNGEANPYRPNNAAFGFDYDTVRGSSVDGLSPTQFGFVTVGELLNAKGFDSSQHSQLPPFGTAAATTIGNLPVAGKPYPGDFVKAVSLMALLDSQYLVTRSNTFTVYASVMDREDPKSSMRLQETVDRSDLLPRLSYVFKDPTPGSKIEYPLSGDVLNHQVRSSWPVVPALMDWAPEDLVGETPVRTVNPNAAVRTISTHRIGYFNARYDP